MISFSSDPVSSSSVGGNTPLINDIREEWTEWLMLTGRLQQITTFYNCGQRKSISERTTHQTSCGGSATTVGFRSHQAKAWTWNYSGRKRSKTCLEKHSDVGLEHYMTCICMIFVQLFLIKWSASLCTKSSLHNSPSYQPNQFSEHAHNQIKRGLHILPVRSLMNFRLSCRQTTTGN